jgi:hypothetical protein
MISWTPRARVTSPRPRGREESAVIAKDRVALAEQLSEQRGPLLAEQLAQSRVEIVLACDSNLCHLSPGVGQVEADTVPRAEPPIRPNWPTAMNVRGMSRRSVARPGAQ